MTMRRILQLAIRAMHLTPAGALSAKSKAAEDGRTPKPGEHLEAAARTGVKCVGRLAIIGTIWSASPAMTGQSTSHTEKPTLYYIPHTHWEGAVFKTREEYLEMGLPNILKALHLLKMYPEYKFTLDQVAYFKPFLERYPEE